MEKEKIITEENKEMEFVAPKYQYNDVKNVYLKFKNGKPKQKLRNFVAEKARALSNINGFSFNHNRDNLIESYNIGDLAAMQILINEEVEMFGKKQIKAQEKLNKLKAEQDENENKR